MMFVKLVAVFWFDPTIFVGLCQYNIVLLYYNIEFQLKFIWLPPKHCRGTWAAPKNLWAS